MEQRIAQLAKHLKTILTDAICLQPNEQALVIYDTEAPLTRIMTEAYREALPQGRFVDFATVTPGDIFTSIENLKAGDLVILVQSTNFRLSEFRIRIELFKRGLKAIEHSHLLRMSEDQFDTYIAALAYDKQRLRRQGHALKNILDTCNTVTVECEDTTLTFSGGMEDTKLNVGDYSGMTNVGGTFPIGEVFTEAKDLTKVQGSIRVFGFAGDDHAVRLFSPFIATVTDGILDASDCPAEFTHVLNLIREDEPVTVREFGLGLNDALGKNKIVNDITAFERQKGLHLSLGAKHAQYNKEGFNRKTGRYHVDIFVDAKRILADDVVIYENGDFTV